jgi:hypothetical protein
MKITIVAGSLLTGFLLLMIPNVNSIEFQNQRNIINNVKETMDYPSFVKMVKQIPKDELRALYKDAIRNVSNDTAICKILLLIFLVCLILVVSIAFALIIYVYAYLLGCEWTIIIKPSLTINTDSPCSSCALEK